MSFCSYWTNPDKINSIEHLGQLENSLRESLNQIRSCKVCLFLWCSSGEITHTHTLFLLVIQQLLCFWLNDYISSLVDLDSMWLNAGSIRIFILAYLWENPWPWSSLWSYACWEEFGDQLFNIPFFFLNG